MTAVSSAIKFAGSVADGTFLPEATVAPMQDQYRTNTVETPASEAT